MTTLNDPDAALRDNIRAAVDKLNAASRLAGMAGSLEVPFGPKQADHPSTGKECPACHEPMKAGEFTALVTLGPGRDRETQERMLAGRPYNAVALEVHYECKNGVTAQELIDLAARG